MKHERNDILIASTWDAYRALRLVLLLVGPIVSLAFAARLGGGIERASIHTAVMLLWSPLFFSVPALLLQNERDAALPRERNSLVRGAKLVPYLLSTRSPVRAEMLVSTGAWLLLVVATWGSSTTVIARVAASLLA